MIELEPGILSPEQLQQQELDKRPLTAFQRTFAKWGLDNNTISYEDLQKASFKSRFQTFLTSIHEYGHAVVAQGVGWAVQELSVIPQGVVRGYTRFKPYAEALASRLFKHIAVALGSYAMQERFGIDPTRGTGSDLPVAKKYSKFLEILSRGHVSAETYFNQALTMARGYVRQPSYNWIIDRAGQLESQGMING